MNTSLLVLIFLALIFLGFLILRRRETEPKADQSLVLLQNQVNEISRVLDFKLSESNKAFLEESGKSTRLIKEITQELTKVGEGQKQVIDVAKQLESLQDVLKNPKQRGVLGEYYLETVLKNVFPPEMFKMQYHLGADKKTGKELIVDAVIILKDKKIPVDSKFSLENYNRLVEAKEIGEKEKYEAAFVDDLKTRIEETSKYILPERGTTEFAFMFIPAEAVYYDLLINKVGAVKSSTRSLIQYAMGEKKVVIVSPTTFLAYLQTVLQGLKAMQIEESAKEIIKKVGELGKHLLNHEEYMKKLGGHLGTTVNMYNVASKEFKKIDKDVLKISGVEMNVEPLTLEPPEKDEE